MPRPPRRATTWCASIRARPAASGRSKWSCTSSRADPGAYVCRLFRQSRSQLRGARAAPAAVDHVRKPGGGRSSGRRSAGALARLARRATRSAPRAGRRHDRRPAICLRFGPRARGTALAAIRVGQLSQGPAAAGSRLRPDGSRAQGLCLRSGGHDDRHADGGSARAAAGRLSGLRPFADRLFEIAGVWRRDM